MSVCFFILSRHTAASVSSLIVNMFQGTGTSKNCLREYYQYILSYFYYSFIFFLFLVFITLSSRVPILPETWASDTASRRSRSNNRTWCSPDATRSRISPSCRSIRGMTEIRDRLDLRLFLPVNRYNRSVHDVDPDTRRKLPTIFSAVSAGERYHSMAQIVVIIVERQTVGRYQSEVREFYEIAAKRTI